MLKLRSAIKKVPARSLFVSEPEPYMFGNDENPIDEKELKEKSWSNSNWLKSRFHFQFAESRQPPSNFGILRVLNDDLVQPQRGFGTHGHQNMEIATFILNGELTHKDSMKTKESLGRGSVQYMSAGSGVRHSEHNTSLTPLRFLQLWVMPDKVGLKPNYGGYDGTTTTAYDKRHNQWHHIISSFDNKDVDTEIKLHQDVNMYFAEIDPKQSLKLEINEGRQAYFIQAEGDSIITKQSDNNNEIELNEQDGCELFGPLDLNISITSIDKPAYLLVIEMKYVGDTRFR